MRPLNRQLYVGFRTVGQLIDVARTPRGQHGGRRHVPRESLCAADLCVLDYLRRHGGRATQREIERGAFGRPRGSGSIAPTLNGLWERRLVRFLPGDVVELIGGGR